MFTFHVGVLLAVFFAFVVVPVIVIASVRLFLSILDTNRKAGPHTIRRIH